MLTCWHHKQASLNILDHSKVCMLTQAASMEPQADWPSMSRQLLTHIFEQQHNALDNCAAACVCSSWHSAVNHSHISSLHLHANNRHCNRHWASFLGSRRSLGKLVMTVSQEIAQGLDQEQWIKGNARCANWTCLQSIPMDCESLEVAETFCDDLHYYTEQQANLKQLIIPSDHHHRGHGHCKLPDIRHLTQLRTLDMRHVTKRKKQDMSHLMQLMALDIQEGLQDNECTAMGNSLSNYPESMRHLIVHGYILQAEWHLLYPYNVSRLGSGLQSLVSVTFVDSALAFVGGSIACLSGLQCLCLQKCKVAADWDNLSSLTNLTSLILESYVAFKTFIIHDVFPKAVKALVCFRGWSGLRVLNVIGCNLFNEQTEMDTPFA